MNKVICSEWWLYYGEGTLSRHIDNIKINLFNKNNE